MGTYISKLIVLISIMSNLAQADTQKSLSEIAKNPDGTVKLMMYPEAVRYCSQQGGRLPTGREFSILSINHGAAGIIERSQIKNEKEEAKILKKGYILIIQRELNGSIDEFYFSSVGYKRPQGDLGKYSFWSSSLTSDLLDMAKVYSGEIGIVAYHEWIYETDKIYARAVICTKEE